MRQLKAYVFLIVILGVTGRPFSATAPTDSLYASAVKQIGQVPVEESLRAFQLISERDRKFAPAYHRSAELYLSLNSLEGRIEAALEA